jgi:hypothetical protein
MTILPTAKLTHEAYAMGELVWNDNEWKNEVLKILGAKWEA